MSKKLYAAFLPLLAVAAFAVMPAVAQAQPHWYSNGKLIKAGTNVAVTTHSTPAGLSLKALGVDIVCTVKDKGTIKNPVGGGAGEDSITEFVNTECKPSVPPCETGEKVGLTASRGGNPLSAANEWPSTLLAGPPIRDQIREIEINVVCSTKGVIDTFTGNLTPEMVNGTTGSLKGCEAGTDTVANFDEPGSGFLLDPALNKGFPDGKDCIWGPAGDEVITVKNP
jgi:hypothetical protein